LIFIEDSKPMFRAKARVNIPQISSIRFGAPNLRSIGAYCFLIRKQIT